MRTAAVDREKFKGVFALLLTPFQNNLEIDWNAYDAYVEWQLQSGAGGLFAVCGSSEMKWLTLEERLALARRAVKRANSTPVVATANLELDSHQQEEELRRMCDTGVSGVVLVPPETFQDDPDRLREHLARLASRASCPVMLYELPPTRIDPAMYADLTANDGFFGIKDTTCTIDGIKAKIDASPDSIVYQANTPLLPEAIAAGAGGIMSTISTAAAKLTTLYFESAVNRRGDAASLHRELVFLDGMLKPAFPATAKYVAELAGLPIGAHYTRRPAELRAMHMKALQVWYDSVQSRYYS
ncbi:MAG: dihydrodipicolinate synthase family protein [Paenibacillus sp.]|jgi:4-hydroxy-tetrahydrodipicolinate synthase|nr:dihydrodipicolinate synthase family protein [Paenibacillus sp.]